MPPISAMIADPRLAAEPAAAAVRHGVRWLWIGVGVTLIVAGFVIAPLPGPLGFPVTLAGLIVVLRNSREARRTFVKAQRRHPRIVYPMRRVLRRWQAIVPVMWQQMLRGEKLILRRFRFLKRLRLALLRRFRILKRGSLAVMRRG